MSYLLLVIYSIQFGCVLLLSLFAFSQQFYWRVCPLNIQYRFHLVLLCRVNICGVFPFSIFIDLIKWDRKTRNAYIHTSVYLSIHVCVIVYTRCCLSKKWAHATTLQNADNIFSLFLGLENTLSVVVVVVLLLLFVCFSTFLLLSPIKLDFWKRLKKLVGNEF